MVGGVVYLEICSHVVIGEQPPDRFGRAPDDCGVFAPWCDGVQDKGCVWVFCLYSF